MQEYTFLQSSGTYVYVHMYTLAFVKYFISDTFLFQQIFAKSQLAFQGIQSIPRALRALGIDFDPLGYFNTYTYLYGQVMY